MAFVDPSVSAGVAAAFGGGVAIAGAFISFVRRAFVAWRETRAELPSSGRAEATAAMGSGRATPPPMPLLSEEAIDLRAVLTELRAFAKHYDEQYRRTHEAVRDVETLLIQMRPLMETIKATADLTFDATDGLPFRLDAIKEATARLEAKK